jgi:hypothetical protein
MKFSKLVVWFTLIVFAAAFTACGGGGGKYADAKKVMGKLIKAMDSHVAELEKADNAKDFAAGIRSMAKTLGELKADMEKLDETYPELRDLDSPPPELAEEAAQIEALGEKMRKIMMKMMQFGDDPDVQAAMEELNKAGIMM